MEYGFKTSLYPAQKQLIADATSVIQSKQVGVFSSPTGTGKTLSLLCTSMNFLKGQGNNDNDDLYALLSTASRTKIYYCSRTHTQLNQAINELRGSAHTYSSIVLGSRRQYCLNSSVCKIQDIDLMNNKCRELVRDDACKFYDGFHYTGETMDIEDLRKAGKEHVFCPYYYSRNRAPGCELVFLPYSLLFTNEGRKSLDINLEGKILIVDEAHNICDTVIELNSAEVAWADIRRMVAICSISTDLGLIVKKLLEFSRTIVQEGVVDVLKFTMNTGLSAFNMFEMEEFIASEKLAQKNDMPVLFEFAKFLKLLTFSDESGRIFYDRQKIRFTPLSAGMYFEEIRKCRAVLFAGGTMEPISQIKGIFPGLKYFCYPPVSTRFLSLIITETLNKRKIRLSFEERDAQVDDVVNTLVALSNPVQAGGIVLFVPSRHFLDMIKNSEKVRNFRRRVRYEDEAVFEKHKNDPQVLVAVMGGRLSEGINFSDDMCRLLVVVGVPYPTVTLEFAERARYAADYGALAAMKVVNQTLGRALRHKKDHAALVLLDSRYLALKDKLSPWIMKDTKIAGPVDGLVQIRQFLKKMAGE